MTINTNKVPKSTTPREPITPGTYPGRLVQILDLGLQPQRPFKGKEKNPANMLWITYELGTNFIKDEDGNDDKEKPRWVSEDFPLFSLEADRAKSTLRYNALDPTGAAEGDWDNLIGFPCAITVVNNTRNDRVYDNVGSVAPMMEGFEVAELVNEAKVFTLDDPDLDVFNSLPDFLKEKIQGNLNYQGSTLQALLGETPAPAGEETPDSIDEEKEENPWGNG